MAKILWYPAVCCGGETHSLLNADQPDILRALRMMDAHFLWHPYLHDEAHDGPQPGLREISEECIAGRQELDVLMVEGALSLDPSDEATPQIAALARRARFVLAAGTCASFGGLMTCGPLGPSVTGLQYRQSRAGGLLGERFRSAGGLPVVNVPGCPAHPDWIVGTLFGLISGRFSAADLDRYQRPLVFFSRLAHHACPRNEFYEFKSSAQEYSQQGCLFENLGCKGTQCESDCNLRLWLGRTGSCPRGGFPCLSCTSPRFPEGFTPFFETHKIGGIPTTLPRDVPKAWYVGISGLSKLACPKRLRRSAISYTADGVEWETRSDDADEKSGI